MPCSYFKAVGGFILIAGPAPTVIQAVAGGACLAAITLFYLLVDPFTSSHARSPGLLGVLEVEREIGGCLLLSCAVGMSLGWDLGPEGRRSRR